jgi:hypothetical protein
VLAQCGRPEGPLLRPSFGLALSGPRVFAADAESIGAGLRASSVPAVPTGAELRRALTSSASLGWRMVSSESASRGSRGNQRLCLRATPRYPREVDVTVLAEGRERFGAIAAVPSRTAASSASLSRASVRVSFRSSAKRLPRVEKLSSAARTRGLQAAKFKVSRWAADS